MTDYERFGDYRPSERSTVGTAVTFLCIGLGVGSLVALLLGVSLLPTLVGLTGGVYFAGALMLGVAFVVLAARQAAAPSLAGARRVLFASLLYLPALLALLAFDKV